MIRPTFLRGALALSLILLVSGAPETGAPVRNRVQSQPPLPPVLISDQTFQPDDWHVSAGDASDASFTVTQQLTGGFGSPPFRFMSHRLSPVPGSGGNTIFVTHLYLGTTYSPSLQGAIAAIDYTESGKIFSFPFPEAFSTTQPVVAQNGHIYRSPEFIRFIAANSSHDWEAKSLAGLTTADFIRVGGNENDHPDFSSSGGPIQFGFTRINSRTSTQPPVPANQDMVIDQGVDNWQLIVHRRRDAVVNQPPQAVDDVFILDGYKRSLPLFEIFDVVMNDSDPDLDSLEVITVTQPTYGSASSLSQHTVAYQLDEARASDAFGYTLSDGELTDTARAAVLIDCACTVLCLNQLELSTTATFPHSPVTDTIDLPLIYRFRNQVLKPAQDGRRYVDMYYTHNPEILVNILMSETLRAEAVDMVELWQDNLRSLTDGDGSALITQAQIDALELFLSHLSAASSEQLQQIIAGEMTHVGPLDDYVGLNVKAAKRRAIGDAKVFLPQMRK